jgi:FkbM family methyltransferase
MGDLLKYLLRNLGEFFRGRRRIKKLVEKSFGVRIYCARPHGREDVSDIGGCGDEIATIFDIGAHVGQSALKFIEAFPQAAIYCFEPVTSNFKELKNNVAGHVNIRCFPCAFGSKQGTTKIFLTNHSSTSSLIEPEYTTGSEVVQVQTMDNFARNNKIDQIDLLKIDTEGFDLEVLKGASYLLSGRGIIFVLVEVGFDPGDKRHVLFDDVRSFLLERGYALFGIYDQTLEWSGDKRLRFANVCFRKITD